MAPSFLLYLSSGKTKPISFFIFSCCMCRARHDAREMIACLTIVFVECNSCFSLFFSAEAPSPLLSVHFSTLGEWLQDEGEEEEQLAQEGGHGATFIFLYPNDIFRFFHKEKKERGPPTGQLKKKKEKKKMLLTPKRRTSRVPPPCLPFQVNGPRKKDSGYAFRID